MKRRAGCVSTSPDAVRAVLPGAVHREAPKREASRPVERAGQLEIRPFVEAEADAFEGEVQIDHHRQFGSGAGHPARQHGLTGR